MTTRRRLLWYLAGGAVVVAAAGTGGFELAGHDAAPAKGTVPGKGAAPGKGAISQRGKDCDLPATRFAYYAKPGPQYSGAFHSKARRAEVGYTIAYPPGHKPGDRLPLILMLHGYGFNHANALQGLTPAQAVALEVSGAPLPPMAMVTVDGGRGYWNPHPGDNAQAMLTDELIPLCQRKGLGTGPRKIAAMGISMGGYGGILLAEKYPDLLAGVAAISPAIYTSYAQAHATTPLAYASAATFAANDAVTHAAALKVPVRIASGYGDQYYPGAQALARALPRNPGGVPAEVHFGKGCHARSFFNAQEPPSLAFLARYLTSRA